MKKKHIFLAVKLLLTLIAIAIVFSQIDMKSVITLFSSANILFLVAALLVNFLLIVLNAFKIRILLPGHTLGIPYIALTNCAANIFRFMVPTDIGAELGRAYYFNRKIGSSAASFSAIIIDRYTGLFAQVAVMTAASLTAVIAGGTSFWTRLCIVGAIGVVCLIIFPLLFFRLPAIKQSSKRGLRRLTGVLSQLSSALVAFRSMPLRLAAAAAIALLYHGGVLLMIMAVSRAFHTSISFPQAAVITVVASLGFIVPSLAGLGITEGVYAGMFGYFLNDKEIGIAVSLSIRVITVITMIPGILFFLSGEKAMEKAPSPGEINV
jgi:glycosyltransferase 2 family protein